SMAITFLGEGEIHCNLESVVLFKRYDGPQKYILTTFSGMVLFFVFYIVGVLVFAQNRVALLDVLRRGACILSFGKKNANISALLIGAMTVISSLPMAGERIGMALQILLLLLAIMMLPKKKPQKAEGVMSYAWVLFILMTFVSGMMAPKVVPFISVYLLAMFCLAVRLQDLVPVARGVLFSIPVVMVLNFVMGSFDGSLPFAGAFSSSEKLGFYGLTLVLAGLYLLGKDLPKKDGLLLGCETFAIALGFVYLRRAWENRMLLFAAIALVLFFVLSAKEISLLLKEKGVTVFAAPVVAFVGAVVVFLFMKMPGLYLNLDTSLREYSALADRSVDLNFWLPQWNLLGHSDMPEALAEAQMLAAPRFYNGLLQLFYDKGAYALVFAVMGFGGATWSLIRKKNRKEGILLLIFFLAGLSGNVEITGGSALYFFGYVLAMWLTNENDTSHTLC
nr:hypothetical protein [Lachnospiraceae bacterium]